MVTPQQIDAYLKRVPPMPETLKETIAALQAGDLAAASRAAAKEPAMIDYLKRVVNSAAYGFKTTISDPAQIFSVLGTARAKELLYAYMVNRIVPESWRYFSLDHDEFIRFQTQLLHRWEKLVAHLNADERFLSAAAIMSAGLVVADAIFGDHASDVALLRESGDYDLDTILRRVSHIGFDRLVEEIAKRWEMEPSVIHLVRLAFGHLPCEGEEEQICRLARLLHLLLFYELSRPALLEAGANAFISFNPDFTLPVLETFEEVVEAA